MKRFILLGRPGCRLCEDFLADLVDAFPQFAGQVTQASVDDKPEWQLVYGVRIPVLLDDRGQVLAEGRFNADALRPLFRQA